MRDSRVREIAQHAAVGAAIGGVAMGPVGVVIGATKGLVFGTAITEESVRDPVERLTRELEPSGLRHVRISTADHLVGLRCAAHQALHNHVISQLPAAPFALLRAGEGQTHTPPPRTISSTRGMGLHHRHVHAA